MFGTEQSKPNLIGFLNLVLMPEERIVDVEFMNNESQGETKEHRNCIFDIICKDANGDTYLVEMQNSAVNNIKERIIYYTCRIIDRMGLKGEGWDYIRIKKVYSICLMNFTLDSNAKLRTNIKLFDEDDVHKPFTDKFNLILLQLPCLKANSLNECNKYYEYLLFLLKEMQQGMKTIEQLKEEVAATKLPQETKDLFYRVLNTADRASLSEEETLRYETDLKNYLDTMGGISYAEQKGRKEGIEEEKIETIKIMNNDGASIELISKYTRLSIDEVKKIISSL